MNANLFPRLHRAAVDRLLEKLDSRTRGSVFALASSLPDAVSYASTGGTKVAHSTLTEIRAAILKIAKEAGYPKAPDRAGAASFDANVCVWLALYEDVGGGEFLRDDVWACIATALLPDVVIWRFSITARERFHGGIRNTFQRLWLRSQLFDRGEEHPSRWEILEKLSEDALVQITERPSISNSKALSIALAEGWLEASKKYGAAQMESLMRKVTLQLRLQNEIRHLPSLRGDSLAEMINNLFVQAAVSSGGKPVTKARRCN